MKANEATYNRPEGDRILDAPYVVADIDKYIEILEDEKARRTNERNSITLFKTQGVTTVLIHLNDGSFLGENVIDGIAVLQVIKGKIKMNTDAGNVVLTARQIITLHKNICISIQALEDSVLLLSNYITPMIKPEDVEEKSF